MTDDITTNETNAHDSLLGLDRIINSNALIDNIKKLEEKSITASHVQFLDLLCSPSNIIATGAVDESLNLILMAGLIDTVAGGRVKGKIVVLTGSDESVTALKSIVDSLNPGCDISVAALTSDADYSSSDAGLFIGTKSSIIEAIQNDYLPAGNVKKVVLHNITDTSAIEEFFKNIETSPKVVVLTENYNAELQESLKKRASNARNITLTDENHELEYHLYEVGSDLLDKTNALSDLVEMSGGKSHLIFCNSASDTDLVAVILGKRGFNVEKFIMDRFSHGALRGITNRVRNNEVSVVVTNDESGAELDSGHFDVVVHYGIPEKPEEFTQRTDGSFAGRPSTVFALINPLDFTNFHYIKKVTNIEFQEKDLPSAEEVLASKLNRLVEEAVAGNFMQDEKLLALLPLIANHEQKDQLIAYLLHNTLEVLPTLKKAAESSRSRGERGDRGDRRERRDNRREGRGSRDRDGGRNETRSRRGKREDRRDNRRGNRRDEDYEARDNGNGDRRDRQQREQLPPPKKDIRFYIGHGSKDNFTQEEFNEIVKTQCELTEDDIKRFSIRDSYSFSDFAEEHAESIVEKLAGASLKNGNELFIKRATTINVPREKVAETAETIENPKNAPEEKVEENPIEQETEVPVVAEEAESSPL